MKIKEFLIRANKSPMLNKYWPITGESLQNVAYVKEDYDEIPALRELAKLLDASLLQPTAADAARALTEQDKSYKYLRHQQLLRIESNQKLLCRIREKELAIPATGLIPSENSVIDEGALLVQISSLLNKWHLPLRYSVALRELILFNRIVPAMSGINWLTAESNRAAGISWDTDVSKEDILAAIQEDPLDFFSGTFWPAKKFSGKHFEDGEQLMSMMVRQSKPIESRPPRKSNIQSQKESLISEFNNLKGNDSERFKQLHRKHPKLTESAIRKRIKGQ